jgi:hypothetical protein
LRAGQLRGLRGQVYFRSKSQPGHVQCSVSDLPNVRNSILPTQGGRKGDILIFGLSSYDSFSNTVRGSCWLSNSFIN